MYREGHLDFSGLLIYIYIHTHTLFFGHLQERIFVLIACFFSLVFCSVFLCDGGGGGGGGLQFWVQHLGVLSTRVIIPTLRPESQTLKL